MNDNFVPVLSSLSLYNKLMMWIKTDRVSGVTRLRSNLVGSAGRELHGDDGAGGDRESLECRRPSSGAFLCPLGHILAYI